MLSGRLPDPRICRCRDCHFRNRHRIEHSHILGRRLDVTAFASLSDADGLVMVWDQLQKIGVRVALGADTARVVRSVVFPGLRPVLAGICVGIAGAAALGDFLSTVLFEIKPLDPATFALGLLALIGVALVACLAPALRAAMLDPVAAPRQE